MKRERKWHLSAISAAVSIGCAVIILARPFTATAMLWMFTGASLLAEAAFDPAALFASRRKQEIEIEKR